MKCRQYSIFAIGNLCANSENLEGIVREGCLKTLIRYAFPSTDASAVDVQFQAIAAIRGLGTHQTIRLQLVREGALEPLILAVQSESVEVQREVAAALCNLALAEENKVTMARSGVVGALIALMQSRDVVRETHACACLANLAEMVEGRTQRRLVDEGSLRYLLNLASSEDPEVRREVARAMALFAAKRDSHAALQRAGSVPCLVQFAPKGEDTVSRRFGCLGIGNLAIVTANHQELFDSGAIASLLPLAVCDDLETRRCTAFGLNNVASNEKNHRVLRKDGRPPTLSRSDQGQGPGHAFTSVSSGAAASLTPKCRFQFVEMKGLQPLLALADSDSIEVQRELAAALRNLSLSEQNKISIVREGGMDVLIKFAHSLDVEIAHQSCGVLANQRKRSRTRAR